MEPLDLPITSSSAVSFSCPLFSGRSKADALRLPLLLYLPGLDGTGWAAATQFAALHQLFELHCMSVPPGNRQSLDSLCDTVCAHTERFQAEQPGRPIVLFGESMGGMLALLAVQQARRGLFRQLVLVNPASSYRDTFWTRLTPLLTSLPPEAYTALPFALSPLLGDPLRMLGSQLAAAAATAAEDLSSAGGASASPSDVLGGAAGALAKSLSRLGGLATLLPTETLQHRLTLLEEGSTRLGGYGCAVSTFCVVGSADRLIPSASEGPKIVDSVRAAGGAALLHVVEGGSHTLLQEGSTNLCELLLEKGVYAPLLSEARAVAAAAEAAAAASAADSNGDAVAEHLPKAPKHRPSHSSRIKLGKEAYPSPAALARLRPNVQALRRVVSPVFFTIDGGGRVSQGLAHLPSLADGPLLFVGNHQLFATDLGLLVDELLSQKSLLLRGLAHPAVFQQLTENDSNTGSLAAFGAVPVSGKALHTLLSAGEAALLFPGGVREAYKARGEAYSLIWPSKPEFVRHALRTGARIVPFAAVGAEDSFSYVADAQELLATPILGDLLRQRAADVPAARRVDTRATQDGGPAEVFIPPFALPTSPPRRYYFRFGQPIGGLRSDADDPRAVAALYDTVREEVQAGIFWLLEKRERDPFAELAPRLLYEAVTSSTAPTFKV